MKKCKECGREEWGFLSVLDKDGYCPRCATIHNGEKVKKLQEQLNEANAIIEDMRPFIQASMSRQTFTRILNYEYKWGVK